MKLFTKKWWDRPGPARWTGPGFRATISPICKLFFKNTFVDLIYVWHLQRGLVCVKKTPLLTYCCIKNILRSKFNFRSHKYHNNRCYNVRIKFFVFNSINMAYTINNFVTINKLHSIWFCIKLNLVLLGSMDIYFTGKKCCAKDVNTMRFIVPTWPGIARSGLKMCRRPYMFPTHRL